MLLCAIAIIAGFLRGLAGFGSGMLMAGPMALLLEPTIAVATIIILETCISLPLMKAAKQDVNWSLVKRLLLGAIFIAPFGVLSLQVLSAKSAGQVISLLVIIAALALLFGYKRKESSTKVKEITVGGVSGFFCGIAGISGPPVVLYLLSWRHNHMEIRATLIYYFGFIDFYVLIVLLIIDDFSMLPFIIALACFPFMWFGATLGCKKLASTNPTQYKSWALSTIIVGNVISLIAVLLR
ncbi:hypothetical protein CMT41_10305 [Colwellia sp. MT41]|nr:hypothetical protein CMT41_10305 [Colwellia sp. MT41]